MSTESASAALVGFSTDFPLGGTSHAEHISDANNLQVQQEGPFTGA
jgi:hypothetical protein